MECSQNLCRRSITCSCGDRQNEKNLAPYASIRGEICLKFSETYANNQHDSGVTVGAYVGETDMLTCASIVQMHKAKGFA